MNNLKRGTYYSGWWISPECKIIYVDDHFGYLLEHPDMFGIKKPDVPFSPKGPDREVWLRKVMADGWVRVREHKGYTTYEFWEMNNNTFHNIKQHLKALGLSSTDPILLSELNKENHLNTTAEYILSEEAFVQLVANKMTYRKIKDK